MYSCADGIQASKPILVKSPDEIQIMQEANQIVAEILCTVQDAVEPGISTFELDQMAEDLCRKRKSIPAFKGYHGFPASLCTSINEEVVHGIPSRKRKLKKVISFPLTLVSITRVFLAILLLPFLLER